jgi:hypothetical protein
LNVGGGSKDCPISAHYAGWRHDLLDIDPKANPDILLDGRALVSLPAAQYDAVYCSHNLEHYHRHDAATVVRGFSHVLREDGFAEVYVPDIQAVMEHVGRTGLDIDDVLYQATAGPILVRDVLYGYHVEIETTGNDFFAHKTGFSRKALAHLFAGQGFPFQMMRATSAFEICGFFFKRCPTAETCRLLGLPELPASGG